MGQPRIPVCGMDFLGCKQPASAADPGPRTKKDNTRELREYCEYHDSIYADLRQMLLKVQGHRRGATTALVTLIVYGHVKADGS